jgi:predicted TIM-barrel fold metal-dependent hydrolase
VVIDIHTHITENGKWFNTSFDASEDALLKQMDDAKIDKSVLLPIYNFISNGFIAKSVKRHPDRFIGFGCLSVNSWKKDLNEILELGLKGIKFHPRIQHETIAQWEERGVLSEIEKAGIPLLVCGWQQTSSAIADMQNIQPIQIDRIAKKYKDLKIVMAHLGGHKFWDAFFCARSNPNIYLDCSYFFDFFRRTSIEDDFWTIFKKIDEKIIFGTDFPEVNSKAYKDYLDKKADDYKLDISKIYYANPDKVLT